MLVKHAGLYVAFSSRSLHYWWNMPGKGLRMLNLFLCFS